MKNYSKLRSATPSRERMYELVRQPIITEKATLLSEFNQVTFSVPLNSNKFELKSAVEKLFDVKVLSVNTLRQEGKTKRFKGRAGKRAGFKKAIVTLDEGHSIDVSTGI
jgi:large subunit ribosomal protein L23